MSPLLEKFNQRCMERSAERCLTFTEDGLVLGVSVLAKFAGGDLQMDEQRVLALLSATYGERYIKRSIDYIRAAHKANEQGDAALAAMHLALALPCAQLHTLRPQDVAFALFKAEMALSGGASTQQLLKSLGLFKDDDSDDKEDDGEDATDTADSDFNEEHPRWPAGAPDSTGGQFRPKDGGDDSGYSPTDQSSGTVAAVTSVEPLANTTTQTQSDSSYNPLETPTTIFLPLPIESLFGETVGIAATDAAVETAGTDASQIIAPDGKLLGELGNGPDVQVMTNGYNGQTGINGAQELFKDLTTGKDALDITPTGYKGTMMQLPNGDIIGIRPISTSGEPAVDVNINGNYTKFKFVQ